MYKLIVALVLVLVAFASLFIWISKRPVSWNQAKSSNLNFSISYPSTWRQSEDQNLFSLVDTKSSDKNFRTYIRISSQDNTDNLFGKLYQMASGSEIKELSEKTQVINRSAVKGDYTMVDGQTSFFVHEQTIMPGPYYTEAIYTLKGDKIYIFRLTAASAEELAREKPVFLAIMPAVHFN